MFRSQIRRLERDKEMLNRGNWHQLKKCMKKAEKGEAVTVGFLGGSITQGSCASTPELCYAYLVYKWWEKKFPQSKITYLNAGIGGTTSQFGAVRVKEHVLKYQPDFLLIEFAVNDDNNALFEETYEGLIRNVCKSKPLPAVLLMNNVRYDNGKSAEEVHLKVAKAYGLPMISMKETIWPEIENGRLKSRDITTDDLHPNDTGHALIAGKIIDFLEKAYGDLQIEEELFFAEEKVFPDPITENTYENAFRYQNTNSRPRMEGFKADLSIQNGIRDVFKGGFTGCHKKDKISFEILCTGVAVQYRKSVRRPAPIARVTVDGKDEDAVILDGSFEENWGDCLFIDTVTKHMKKEKHKVEIEIIEEHENDAVTFYLVSVIGSD